MDTEIPLPSLRRRMAAWLYEGMLLFGVVFVISYVFSVLTNTRHALDHRMAQQFIVFLGLAVYFIWQWRRSGQTLAMKTWHIKLVAADGRSPLALSQAVIRYLISYIWFVPGLAVAKAFELSTSGTVWTVIAWVVIWALLSKLNPTKQFLHDRVAKTALISVAPVRQ